MLTDLVQIRTLGEKKRVENERFRRHLKTRDHSDRILRRLAEKVEDQIDCTACANCCRVANVRVTERDVERMSKALRVPRKKFLEGYERGRGRPFEDREGVLLDLLVLEKAAYEVCYEAAYRSDWLPVPLNSLSVLATSMTASEVIDA